MDVMDVIEVLFCKKLVFYADDAGFIFGSREQLIEGSKIIYKGGVERDTQYSMDQLKRGEHFKVHGWKNSNGSTITNIGLIQRTYFLLYSFPGQIAFEHVDALG